MNYKRVMTIAGSDPSGGAGVQADIKTISALGCYATSAITAVVDENTVGVTAVHPVPVNFVMGQIRSILSDVGTDSVKIGMLYSAELIRGVRDTLDEYRDIRDVVLDPVMVATSNDPLLEADAVESLRDVLIPRAAVITPNIPEAEILLGRKITSKDDMPDAARELARLGASVYLKAGHIALDINDATLNGGETLEDPETGSPLILTDIFYNVSTGKMSRLSAPMVKTRNTHGTGCTLSSAVASFLAHGHSVDEAARLGKEYISAAIAAGAPYTIGHGHGPVHHFHSLWKQG